MCYHANGMGIFWHSPLPWAAVATVYWIAVLAPIHAGARQWRTVEYLGWIAAFIVAVMRIGSPIAKTYTSLHATSFGQLLLARSQYFDHQLQRGMTTLAGDLLTTLLILGVFTILAWRTQQSLLASRDSRLIGLGALMVGWPNVFVFLALTFVAAAIAMSFLLATKRKQPDDRIRVLPYVAIGAILTLWLGPWIAHVTGLETIRF